MCAMSSSGTEATNQDKKRLETRAFLLLAVFLVPAIAIAIVVSLGFSIWIYQIIAGPPGHPGDDHSAS